MDQISTNNFFKCEEFDTLFNSQQGLEEHGKYIQKERLLLAIIYIVSSKGEEYSKIKIHSKYCFLNIGVSFHLLANVIFLFSIFIYK